jgi:hypothetical protein
MYTHLYDTVSSIKFASGTLNVKVHPEKQNRNKKKPTVSDRVFDSLSNTVDFFLIAVFFGVDFYMQSFGVYQTT